MQDSGVTTKKHSMQRGVVERRKRALKRLEEDLVYHDTFLSLPENSLKKQRIQKEIEILKGRI